MRSGGAVTDSRVTRAIQLLIGAGPDLWSELVDDAIELMEELCDELPAARVVWCPNDTRETASAAAGHRTWRGLRVIR